MPAAHGPCAALESDRLARWRIRRHFRPKSTPVWATGVLARTAMPSDRPGDAPQPRGSVLTGAPGFRHRQAAHCESGVMSAREHATGAADVRADGVRPRGRRWLCRDSLIRSPDSARRVSDAARRDHPRRAEASRHAHASPDVLGPEPEWPPLDAALHGGRVVGCNAPSLASVLSRGHALSISTPTT